MIEIPVTVELTEAEAKQLLILLSRIRYNVTMSETPFVCSMSDRIHEAISLAQHYEDELRNVDTKDHEDLPF